MNSLFVTSKSLLLSESIYRSSLVTRTHETSKQPAFSNSFNLSKQVSLQFDRRLSVLNLVCVQISWLDNNAFQNLKQKPESFTASVSFLIWSPKDNTNKCLWIVSKTIEFFLNDFCWIHWIQWIVTKHKIGMVTRKLQK